MTMIGRFRQDVATQGTSAMPVRITKKSLQALAPLPDTAIQLLELLDDPDVPLRAITDAVTRDVGISAVILRVANSAMFGLRGHVGSISEALRVIGTAQARLLVLASGFALTAQKELPAYGLAAGTFMRHSETVAHLTMYVAREVGYANIGLAYSAGLLHDIGKIVINGLTGEDKEAGIPADALAAYVQSRCCTLCEAEQAIYGSDHTEVGRELAALWSFPADLSQAIALHHRVTALDGDSTLACCVAVANAAAGAIDAQYAEMNKISLETVRGVVDLDKLWAVAEEYYHTGGEKSR